MSNTLWAIVDIEKKISPRYGKTIYTMKFVGIHDKQIYTTYVDPSNRNFKYWMKYIGTPKKGYVLSDLKIKDPASNLIDADHAPKIEISYNSVDDLAAELEDIWQVAEQA